MTAIRETWILAHRTMLRFARSPELVASSVAFPLLLLVIQLVVFAKLVDKLEGGRYIDRVVPAVMLATAIFSLPVNAAGFFSDLHDGIHSRFRSMPISRTSFVAGPVVGDSAQIATTAACVFAAAVPHGFILHHVHTIGAGFRRRVPTGGANVLLDGRVRRGRVAERRSGPQHVQPR